MSWLFGRKKHHRESPPDTPEESTTEASQSDDYIIIEKEANPHVPNLPTSDGLYPYLGDRPTNSQMYPASMPQQQQAHSGDPQNYLHGIPFKLSKSFDTDFELDRLKVDEIASFVENLKNENYDYDFGLEGSVINEMESGVE